MNTLSDKNIRLALSLSWIFVFFGSDGLNEISNLKLSPELQQGGHGQFLTNISLGITLIYFMYNIAYHHFELAKLKKLKDVLNALAITLESVVFTVYWPLRLFFIHLILPGKDMIPIKLDLKIHFLPFVSLMLDFMFFSVGPWEVTYTEGFTYIVGCTVAYWFWLEYLLEGAPTYPYPFLNVETPIRAAIFAGVAVFAFLFFAFIKSFNTASYAPNGTKTNTNTKTNTKANTKTKTKANANVNVNANNASAKTVEKIN
ncbi:unnamed protein product [Ambrosiozyma monospora]|uniref:Unnamed protein product n=1 Tax=Ambrosiozyma monospora TaxID=43982 RepID=A0A9W7DGI9_AMBMO|nr:unnamed protein product [Ambrosiozyma monospora]